MRKQALGAVAPGDLIYETRQAIQYGRKVPAFFGPQPNLLDCSLPKTRGKAALVIAVLRAYVHPSDLQAFATCMSLEDWAFCVTQPDGLLAWFHLTGSVRKA